MVKCTRCGKENPADVHTCSLPKALALADMIEEDPMTTWGYREASHETAAELRRLHAENEALRDALKLAKTNIADWGSYASEYFQSKHDLQGDLDSIDRALARAGEKT